LHGNHARDRLTLEEQVSEVKTVET